MVEQRTNFDLGPSCHAISPANAESMETQQKQRTKEGQRQTTQGLRKPTIQIGYIHPKFTILFLLFFHQQHHFSSTLARRTLSVQSSCIKQSLLQHSVFFLQFVCVQGVAETKLVESEHKMET